LRNDCVPIEIDDFEVCVALDDVCDNGDPARSASAGAVARSAAAVMEKINLVIEVPH
jgi:hypothetical protein